MDTVEVQRRVDFTFDCKHIGALVASHPDIPAPDSMLNRTYYWDFYGDDALADLRKVRAAMRFNLPAGTVWTKADSTDWYYRNTVTYHNMKIVLSCSRELACERVVTGTRTVTKSVPVTEWVEKEITEDIVEWRCS